MQWIYRGLLGLMSIAYAANARADKLTDAREHFRVGMAAFGLRDYGVAAREYEEAFRLKPDPALLYDAAQAHRFANDKRRALELYDSYLLLYGNSVSNREEVERQLAALHRVIDLEQQAATEPPATPNQMAGESVASPPSPVLAVATAATPAPSTPAPARHRSDTRRVWLWATVAGVTAVALAVGLGVGLGTQSADPRPSMGTVRF